MVLYGDNCSGLRRAPSNAFTVYGAMPQRDAAVIGNTAITEVSQVYLRY